MDGLTDIALRVTGNVTLSRRVVGVLGFAIGAAGLLLSTLTHDPKTCVYFNWIAFAAFEVTVSVSWAIPLDIKAAGDYAGSGRRGDEQLR